LRIILGREFDRGNCRKKTRGKGNMVEKGETKNEERGQSANGEAVY